MNAPVVAAAAAGAAAIVGAEERKTLPTGSFASDNARRSRTSDDMRTNYVLIDYENLQPAAMQLLQHDHFRVIVFVGANQARVSFEAAHALQRMGDRATWLQISGNGSNALDFHIAFYIGQIAAREPDAFFHIISKDSGFDPLIAHLKSLKILSGRWIALTDIPALQVANAKTPQERLVLVIANLQHRGEAKPGTVRTLSSTISALFGKRLTAEQIADLLKQLQDAGAIIIDGTKVRYQLPSP